jgi:hypothetical protein
MREFPNLLMKSGEAAREQNNLLVTQTIEID